MEETLEQELEWSIGVVYDDIEHQDLDLVICYPEEVDGLLSVGANPNKLSEYALCAAVSYGLLNIVKQCITFENVNVIKHCERSLLTIAITGEKNGNYIETIEYLLSIGADICASTTENYNALHAAILHNYMDDSKLLTKAINILCKSKQDIVDLKCKHGTAFSMICKYRNK